MRVKGVLIRRTIGELNKFVMFLANPKGKSPKLQDNRIFTSVNMFLTKTNCKLIYKKKAPLQIFYTFLIYRLQKSDFNKYLLNELVDKIRNTCS
jgi:hypothetical protein